jgi:hypothetical protein
MEEVLRMQKGRGCQHGIGVALRAEASRVRLPRSDRQPEQGLKKEYLPITAEAQTQNIDEGMKRNVWKEPHKSTHPAALSVPVLRESNNEWGIPLARHVLFRS